MMRMTMITLSLFIILTGCMGPDQKKQVSHINPDEAPLQSLIFPKQQYPHYYGFLKKAFQQTKISQCTIDRKHSSSRLVTEKDTDDQMKEGYTRIQWPLPICKESQSNVYIAEMEQSQVKEATQWFEEKVRTYPDDFTLLIRLEQKPLQVITETK